MGPRESQRVVMVCRAIRPAVVIRKVCGGNRTRHGADTQQVLASVVRTARQRGLDLPPPIAEDAAVESLATDIVDLAKVRTDR